MENYPIRKQKSFPGTYYQQILKSHIKLEEKVITTPIVIKKLPMIYPATGWFEIVRYNDKHDAIIENLVYKSQLCRYPRSTITTYDRGNEFLCHAFTNDLIKEYYGIRAKCATKNSPGHSEPCMYVRLEKNTQNRITHVLQ